MTPSPPEPSLFLLRVRDLLRRPVVTCGSGESAADVARLLTRESVGSVVVRDDAGAPVGIVTDSDLRQRVVAARRNADTTTARDIMSTPLVTIRPTAFAFEAILEMTRRRIRHVVVIEDGRAVGVVSSRDFLRLHTTHPVALASEISRAESSAVLARLADRVTRLVRRLVDDGGTPYDIGQIVAELNDRLVARVLELTSEAVAAQGVPVPSVPYCWLAFGSEARREQTLRTDQDNGLVYAEPAPDEREVAAAYYRALASGVIQALVEVGFPPCPGNAMASNPTWCQPLSVWTGHFRQWLDETKPEHILAASIYFDLRPILGKSELAWSLTEIVRGEAPSRSLLLRSLAREVAERSLPLTLLGGIGTARSGPRRGTVDLKSGGVFPLVGAARVGALQLALVETNTIDRIRAAGDAGWYTEAETREIVDAYQHFMRLRLVHQLQQIEHGDAPDNSVPLRRLSRADNLLLRDALRTVSHVQAGLRERFMTDHLA